VDFQPVVNRQSHSDGKLLWSHVSCLMSHAHPRPPYKMHIYDNIMKYNYHKEGGSNLVVLWLFFLIVIAVINGAIAHSKNRSVVAWVLLSIPFGLVATLVVAVIPGLPPENEPWRR